MWATSAVAKTDEERAAHRRRRNVKDVIRDEIYGAALATNAYLDDKDFNASSVVVIDKKEVAKIAKRVVRRTSIGPK